MATYIITYNNRPITTVPGEYHFISKTPTDWEPVTWHGLTSFDGDQVWADNFDRYYEPTVGKYIPRYVYYSNGTEQYVLDRATRTWSPKTWVGLTSFYGYRTWRNTYSSKMMYSYGSTQKTLDSETASWTDVTWTGDMTTEEKKIDGRFIWENYNSSRIRTAYYSVSSSVTGYTYRLSGSNYWRFVSMPQEYVGQNFWYTHTFGTNGGDNTTYYSQGSSNQKRIVQGTQEDVNWGTIEPTYGKYVWTSSSHTYYSYGSNQYVLNDDNTLWLLKTWTGLSSGTTIDGHYVWTDGIFTYYSRGTTHYRLVMP